mgnify:CR=1 FL=1
MDGVVDELLVDAASRLSGDERRAFLGIVCEKLCQGSPRKTEERFGWGRETVRKGLRVGQSVVLPETHCETRGKQRSEDRNPQLAIDIRLVVEPHTHPDPELKSERLMPIFRRPKFVSG